MSSEPETTLSVDEQKEMDAVSQGEDDYESDDPPVDDEAETQASPPPEQPRKYVKRGQNGRAKVSFHCNKRQLTLDSFNATSNNTIQLQLSQLSTQLEVINKRLQKTVKVDDLDKKMNALVTRDEFHNFATAIKKRADEEKQLLSNKIDTLQAENITLKDRLDSLESKLEATDKCAKLADYKANVTSDKCEDLEQHGRANSIRVYGTQDTDISEDEVGTAEIVLDVLRTHLDIHLTKGDIDVSHRLGVWKPDASRGIICKFVKRTDKMLIIKKRKKLVNTGIVIKEDISPANRKLMATVKEKEEIDQVWSDKGKILGKTHDGEIRKFDREIKCAIKNYEKQHDINTDSPQARADTNDDAQFRPTQTRGKKSAYTGGRYGHQHRGGYDYRPRGPGGYSNYQPNRGRGRGSGYRPQATYNAWFDRPY